MPEPTKHTAEKLFIRHKEFPGFVDAYRTGYKGGAAVILRTARRADAETEERGHDDRCHAYLSKESAVALAADILTAAGAEPQDAGLSDLRRHLDEALERVILAEVKDHQAYAKGRDDAIRAAKAVHDEAVSEASNRISDLSTEVRQLRKDKETLLQIQDSQTAALSALQQECDRLTESNNELADAYNTARDDTEEVLARLRGVRKVLDTPAGTDEIRVYL